MTDLYVHTQGDPASPAIVWIHGGAVSGRIWQPQIDALPGYFHLVPDLPEHGRSTTAGAFTLQGAAGDITRLIQERVPGGRASLVGHSVGGALGLEILRTHPDGIERAILSGPTPKLAGGTARLVEWISLPLLRLAGPERFASMVIRSLGVPAASMSLVADDIQTMNPQKFLHVNRAMANVKVPAGPLPPTLVVVGEKEAGISIRHARLLSEWVEGVTGRMVRGLGHGWNLESPALFNETVRAWMEDQPLPPELWPL